MRLWLDRYGFGKDSTLGMLSLVEDGKPPESLCFTIEDERRKAKVPGETCIPVGIYEIKFRADSPKFAHYYTKFPNLHRGMLWLQNVPGFDMVYVHLGNTDDHTEGCILPNTRPVALVDGEFKGEDSATAYTTLYKRVLAAVDKGEPIVMSITEREAA